MIKNFIDSWFKHKDELEEYFRTTTQDNYTHYSDFVKLIFDKIINPDIDDRYDFTFSTKADDIVMIDHGDYQGDYIFLLHKDTYQPSVTEYVYTNVFYGSCSGCDTLYRIQESGNTYYQLPNDWQIKEYMTLCLHLLERCHYMLDEDEDDYEEYEEEE